MTVRFDEVAKSDNIVASIVLRGDISGLSETDRVTYYNRFCDSLGLNPLTRPFQYLSLNGKQVLYATKDATEQLRKINGVSVTGIDTEVIEGVYLVKAHGQDKTGRTDAATGAVPIKGLTGDKLANALMKAETKAKRRLTLSICGLGILDETELETIPPAAMQTVAEIQTNRALPNLEKGREEINKLLERYEPLVAPAVIGAARLDMEAAKSVNDMREVYRNLKQQCESVEREQSRIETVEEAKAAGAILIAREDRDVTSDTEPYIDEGVDAAFSAPLDKAGDLF